jgi:hypothetical protein
MGKNKGSWWYGWVRYTYYDIFSGSEREGRRATDLDFNTAGQAQRAADALAGALASSPSRDRRERRYRSKTEKVPSVFTVIETGVSRADKE